MLSLRRNSDISILIELGKKTLSLLESDNIIFKRPIAIGKAQTPTPIGDWKIINKKILSPDSVFGSRWLGLSTPGYGIHGTNNPLSIGTAASLGCIRMQNKDIEELFRQVTLGTPVKITQVSPASYQIKPGDTIYQIAKKYKLNYKTLLKLNPTVDPLHLIPGTTVYLRKKY